MKFNRRDFLMLIPMVAAAIAAGYWGFLKQTEKVQRLIMQTSTEKETSTSLSKTSASQSEALTTTSGFQETVSEATSLSPTSGGTGFDFPVTWDEASPPQVNIADYRLSVDGDVSKPLTLTLNDLQALPAVDRVIRIVCVTGWSADVPWSGILLSYLLNLAGAPKKIDHITVESVTGYNTTMDSKQLDDPDNMIALRVGGLPLSIEHGYPARLIAPTQPGLNWIKNVKKITCKRALIER